MFTSHYDSLLSYLGLTSLEAVKSYQSPTLIKNHRGHRDILRIDTTFDDAQLILFLKRLWVVPKKDGLKSLFQHGQVRSRAKQEALNYESLAAAGIAVPPVVAYGEQLGPFWENFSFILTVAAPGQTLEDFLRSAPHGSHIRRQTFHALALFVRHLHDAGLFSPDLFTRHIFITNPGLAARFMLIDMARLDLATPTSNRLRARDLAALNITAPLSLVTRTERLRFLRTYHAWAAASLLQKIRRRVQYLLKRNKYRPFMQ